MRGVFQGNGGGGGASAVPHVNAVQTRTVIVVSGIRLRQTAGESPFKTITQVKNDRVTEDV